MWNPQTWKTEFEGILDQLDGIIPIKFTQNQLNGGFHENQNAVVFLGDHYKEANLCLGTCRGILKSLRKVNPLFMTTDFVPMLGIDYTLKGEHAPPFAFIKPYEEATVQGMTIGFRNVEIMDSFYHLKDVLFPKVLKSFQNIISVYEVTLQEQNKLGLTAQTEILALEAMSKEKPSETVTKKLEESRFKLTLANTSYQTLKGQHIQAIEEKDLYNQILLLLKKYVIDGSGERNAASKKAFPRLYGLGEDGNPIDLQALQALINNPQ